MGRQILILVAGFAILAGLMKLNLERHAGDLNRNSTEQYYQSAARNAARSAAELAMSRLWKSPDWRTGYNNMNLNGATVSLQLFDSSTDSTLGPDTIRVAVSSSFGGENAQIAFKVGVDQPSLPFNVKGGITANAWIGTLGTMLVDGRQHDINGNLIANSGTQAINTTDGYVQGGASQLAGTTDAGVDVAPTRTGFDDIVEDFSTWPGGYPDTPEEVLGGAAYGLTPNVLKNAAQSGINGSQYVTDPANLTLPLSGITYVDLPNNGVWRDIDFGASSGILVVHNQWGNALIENMNYGTFQGLIIADDMLHIHATIIGACFLMSEWPRNGYCIGNGSGSILFSEQAIVKALADAQLCMAALSLIEYWE